MTTSTTRLTVLLFLIMFVIGTDTFLISPLIPELQAQFHVPTERAGWMMGAYTLGAALFALIAGPLSDGLNRKYVLFSGLTFFAFSTALCGLSSGFWTMCLFRFLAGVSAAFAAPQVWAAIPALFPVAKVPRMMGIAYAGLAASQALGVPIGSGLAALRWSIPFWAIGSIALLLAVSVFFYVPDIMPRQAPGSRTSLLGRYVPLLTSAKARGGFLGYFFIHLGSNAAFAFLGKWLSDRFSLSLGQTGYVMIGLGVGNLLGSLVSGYAVKKLGPIRTMVSMLIFLATAYAMLPYVPSAGAATGVYLILFAALGILFPLVVGILTGLNASIRGTISSLATSTMNAATTTGAWLAGILYAQFGGYGSVGLFSAGCFLASLTTFIVSGMMHAEKREKQEAATS
jgi:predicted MFS family arabinose efflux permease